MEVLGRRSKAGIWCEEIRRSCRAVRGALDAAIIDKKLRNAEDERIKVSESKSVHRVRTCPETDVEVFRAITTS